LVKHCFITIHRSGTTVIVLSYDLMECFKVHVLLMYRNECFTYHLVN